MHESQNYILVYATEAGEIGARTHRVLPESDEPENTAISVYARDQLRATDWIVTGADQVRELVLRASPAEPIAIPVSTSRDLGWFPDAPYRGIVVLPRYQGPPR